MVVSFLSFPFFSSFFTNYFFSTSFFFSCLELPEHGVRTFGYDVLAFDLTLKSQVRPSYPRHKVVGGMREKDKSNRKLWMILHADNGGETPPMLQVMIEYFKCSGSVECELREQDSG